MAVLCQQEIVGVALAEVRHRLESALFIDVEKMVAKSPDHLLDVATNRIVEDLDEDRRLVLR